MHKVIRQFSLAAAMAAMLAAIGGCNTRRTVSSQTSTSTNVQSRSYLMDAQAFDLETVVGLIKNQQVKNAQELEQAINGGSGINNVDIDKDGQIDYVGVKEVAGNGGQHSLDFVAMPSSKQGDPVTIASVSFSIDTTTNQVVVNGGYPDYVSGYDQFYYSYYVPRGPTFGQLLFYSWLFSPRPLYVYTPYGYGYAPRPILMGGALTTTRTTYRTQTHVSPVAKATRPSNYSIKSAEPTRSRFATQGPSGSGLSNRSGTMRDYTPRSATAPRPTGSAFGASSPTPSTPRPSWGSGSGNRVSTPPPAASRPSWGSGSGSRPSTPSPSRSWGSGSPSPSRSWGSGSSSGSRSWGSGSSSSGSRSWGSSSGSRSSSGGRRR